YKELKRLSNEEIEKYLGANNAPNLKKEH
ncbi:phosphoribosyltransferase, partial [Helicobacter pylori]|nr:phosphoribosyltransferase [Helicobacter pylori]